MLKDYGRQRDENLRQNICNNDIIAFIPGPILHLLIVNDISNPQFKGVWVYGVCLQILSYSIYGTGI